jgi:hypothetical protein
MIDTRLALYFLWGGGVVVVFSVALWRRMRTYRRFRFDRRSGLRLLVRTRVVTGFALWMCAVGASFAIFMVLFGEAGSTPRTFSLAVAMGSLLGAGWVMATEDEALEKEADAK